jgi:hypothetical protein
MDLKLTTLDDIDFSTDDAVLLDGIQAIAQHVKIRLRFFLTEWFLDQRVGVPYYRSILVKNANENIIREILRKVIVQTPGIASLESFTFTFSDTERKERKLLVSFLAKTDSGELLSFNEPLII